MLKATLFGTVTLGDLLTRLEREPRDRRLLLGFGYPKSYRGYYDHIAFTPCDEMTIGDMIDTTYGTIGKAFGGWKGGNFTMNSETPVWIASSGDPGWPLTPALLELMLAEPRE